MANFIIEDFKNAWSKENNALVKIILINVIIFIGASFIEVFLTLSGAGNLFKLIINIFNDLQKFAEIKIREFLTEKVCMHGIFRHHHPSGSIPSISSAQVHRERYAAGREAASRWH